MKNKRGHKTGFISLLLIISLVIGATTEVAAAKNFSTYQEDYIIRITSSHYSQDNFGIKWYLYSTKTLDGVDVFGVDRDGNEMLLASLSPSVTEYEITAKASTYKSLKVACYYMEGGEKVYAATSEEAENSFFSEYLLSDGMIGVNFPTQAEIKTMWKKLSPKSKADKFSTKPKNKKPYKKGQVAGSTLKNGLNTLNFIRYVAGVSSDVNINSSYQSLAQAAAVVNYNDSTNWISHYPAKPKGMSTSLYQQGAEGASQSNLAAGYSNLYDAILGWMSDSDSSNVDRVGHRRWCLNPSMKYTGFGIDGNIYSMYAFDSSGEDEKVHGVAWPAKNTPLQLFNKTDAWSISMGVNVPTEGTKVVLIRNRDKKKWTFTTNNSKISGNYMTINNDNYGQSGCIIFRPKNITYKDGDSFEVQISGTDFSFSYDVTFFSLTKKS